MPNVEGIYYIDRQPVVSIDGTGITMVVGSGEHAYRVRYDRAMWRKMLECSIRQLNEYELAERADRGRVLKLERRRGRH